MEAISRRELFALEIARPRRESTHWIRVQRRAMACRFEVTLHGENGHDVTAAREGLDEVDRIESALTVFRETSDLVRLNRAAGNGPAPVGVEMFGLLRLCHELHAATDGAYDVTSTPLSRCWGFLEREGRLPSPQEIAAARARVGMMKVELDEAARTVRFSRPGMELNLGSIGKGYALGRVGTLLKDRGVADALVSAGGSSVLAMGSDDNGWLIDLRSRQVTRDRLARLRLRDAALGTSGAGEQFVEIGGTRYGHVLDPRTGYPASGVLSASVVTGEPALADALSTAFLVGGPDLARRYCDDHPGTLALVTCDDGTERPQVFGACPGAILEAA